MSRCTGHTPIPTRERLPDTVQERQRVYALYAAMYAAQRIASRTSFLLYAPAAAAPRSDVPARIVLRNILRDAQELARDTSHILRGIHGPLERKDGAA